MDIFTISRGARGRGGAGGSGDAPGGAGGACTGRGGRASSTQRASSEPPGSRRVPTSAAPNAGGGSRQSSLLSHVSPSLERDIGSKFEVPGSWWSGGGASSSARSRFWMVTVAEYSPSHAFAIKNGFINKPGVRFVLDSPQDDDDPDEPLWMTAEVYTKYKTAFKERCDAAELMRKADDLVTSSGVASASNAVTDDVAIDDFNARPVSARYASLTACFFELNSGIPPVALERTTQYTYTCKLDGKLVKEYSPRDAPGPPKSTSKRTTYLRKHFPTIYSRYIEVCNLHSSFACV